MKNKINLLTFILFLLSIGSAGQRASAVQLFDFINYQNHETIAECDALKADWETCLKSPCSETSSGNFRESWLCYVQIAVKNKDELICLNQLSGYNANSQAECLTQLGIVQNDFRICDKIKTLNYPDNPNVVQISPRDKIKDRDYNRCNYALAIHAGYVPGCNKIKELDTGFLNDCHAKSLTKGWKYVSEDPDLCDTFPQKDKKSCDLKALEGLGRPEMEKFLIENFPTVCPKFYGPAEQEGCFQLALKIVSQLESRYFLPSHLEVCQKFPEQYRKQCYDNALESVMELKMGNRLCSGFPEAKVSKAILRDAAAAFSFNSVYLDGPATKQKCFLKAGFFWGDPSKNDPDFLNKNFIGWAIILVLLLANSAVLFFGIRSWKKIFFYFLLAFPFLCGLTFVISDLNGFLDYVPLFYPGLAYLTILSLLGSVAFGLLLKRHPVIPENMASQETSPANPAKRKKTLIVLGILAILLIIAASFYFFLNKEKNPGQVEVSVNGAKPEEAKLSAEEIEKICSAQKDLFKDMCIIEAAADQLSPEVCGKLSSPEMQTECRDTVNGKLADQKEDVSYCLKMGNSKSTDCVVALAEKKGDSALCSNVYYKQSLGPCQKDAEVSRLIAQAVAQQDQKICAGLSFYQDKSRCYSQLGIALNDPSVCDLADERKMEGGQEEFAGWGQPQCYRELAIMNADPDFCEKQLDPGNWKEVCREDVAKIQEIRNQCLGSAPSGSEQAQCLPMAAQVFKATNDCWEKIEFHSAYAPTEIKNCYGKIVDSCVTTFSSEKVQAVCQRTVAEARAKAEKLAGSRPPY